MRTRAPRRPRPPTSRARPGRTRPRENDGGHGTGRAGGPIGPSLPSSFVTSVHRHRAGGVVRDDIRPESSVDEVLPGGSFPDGVRTLARTGGGHVYWDPGFRGLWAGRRGPFSLYTHHGPDNTRIHPLTSEVQSPWVFTNNSTTWDVSTLRIRVSRLRWTDPGVSGDPSPPTLGVRNRGDSFAHEGSLSSRTPVTPPVT